MPEGKSVDRKVTGGHNRAEVAVEPVYDAESFAAENGITAEQARRLINEHGRDRGTLEREAKRLRASA